MQSVKNSRLQYRGDGFGEGLCDSYDLLMVYLFRAFIVNLGDMLERWSNCIFK